MSTVLAALAVSLMALPGELKLKESDHKKLSDLVDAYFTARTEEKSIFESMQKVIEQIETTEKRMKGQKLLAAVGDWEQVFRLVAAERLKPTLKKRGEVATDKLKTDVEINFAYCVPKKPSKGALPLILAACDAGEAPSAHLDTHWNDPALREGAVLMAIDLGKNAESWGVFGTREAPGGTYLLMTALGQIQRQFAVDANRVYLAGSGKGFAAVEATATTYPHLFAGVIGIGDVSVADAGSLDNFRTVPSLFLKGGEGVKAIETKLGELGFANAKLEAEGGAAQAWEWIGKNPRVAYPAEISFAPKSDNAQRIHWLSLVGIQSAEKPSILAKADKASNTVTIDSQKVSGLVIYLNDELVDLDKPVKFVINGTTHERTIERNAPEMINNQYNWGDWGRVYSASVTQDVPSK